MVWYCVIMKFDFDVLKGNQWIAIEIFEDANQVFHSGKFWNIPAGSMIEHPDGEMSHLVHGDYNHSLIGHHGVV